MKTPTSYDVFLCHNSVDKKFVKDVGVVLNDQGIVTWLDENDLPLGHPWFEFIFNNINEFGSVAVFIGPHGIGATQHQEIEQILRQFEKSGKPIIPVLMPGYRTARLEIPVFIKEQLINKMNYVDFEASPEPTEAIRRLVAGIRHTLPSGVMIKPSIAFGRLPESNRSRQGEPIFYFWWAFLHWLGFVMVNSFVGVNWLKPYSSAGVLVTTIAILTALLATGFRQLRQRRIPLDKLGMAIGTGIGAVASYFLVRQSGSLGDVNALAGLATTVATGALAGASGGLVIAGIAAVVAAVGAGTAAALTPWFNLVISRDGHDPDYFSATMAFSLGALLWGLLLSIGLMFIFRNHHRVRTLFSGF